MPSDSSWSTVLRCPRCGGGWRAGATRCWLCEAEVQPVAADSAAAPHAATQFDSPERVGTYSLASLMMFVTLVSVVLGVSTIALGAGIPLGILLLVVWLRTAAVARQRAARGLAVTPVEKMQLFASSFAVTTALLGLVCVAGFSAFWAACFACVGTYLGLEGFLGEDFAVTIGWIVCGAVVLVIGFVTWRYALPRIVRLIRRRWRRDIGDPD